MRSFFLVFALFFSSLFAQTAPFAAQSDLAGDVSDAVLNHIYRRRLGFEPCGCERGAWVQGFGSYRSRNSDGSRERYEESFGGILAGLNYALCCDTEINFFIGGSWGCTDIRDGQPDYDTDSILLGMAFEHTCPNRFLGLTFVGGVLHSDRTIRAPLNVSEDAQGLFIFPELTFAYRWACLPCCPITTVTARYAGWFINDYQVRQVPGTLYIRDRSIQLFTLRAEAALPFETPDCWTFQPYAALAGRFQFDGNRVHARLLLTELRFSDGIDSSLAQIILGARAAKRFGRFDLTANLEGSFDSGNSTRVLGVLTLSTVY